MRYRPALLVFAAMLAVAMPIASAQNVTVQQPVFRNFSVGTTVSVPDRGGAFIGGVKRAGSSRKSFGPFRSGSSFGMFRDYSALSTHVNIHDLGEMDRQILRQANRNAYSGRPTVLTGHAAHAYTMLTARYNSRSRLASKSPRQASGRVASAAGTSPVTSAARSFQLGQNAERKGRMSLARLHYRMAEKLGSARAREKMSALKAHALR
jgi:hypothetical protein